MTCPYFRICEIHKFAEEASKKCEAFKKILDFCETQYPTCEVKKWLDGFKFWFWIVVWAVFCLGYIFGKVF